MNSIISTSDNSHFEILNEFIHLFEDGEVVEIQNNICKKTLIVSKKNFKERYKKLEQDVHQKLRELIEQSNYNSQFISNCKAIRITGIGIDSSNIEELAIIGDQLIFLNDSGYHYSIYNFSLEELIEISNYKLK